jgi:hypothetical protein
MVPHGLELVGFAVVINESEPDSAEAMFKLDLDNVVAPGDLSAEAFTEMARGADEAITEAKAEEAKNSLRRMMGKLGGDTRQGDTP